MLEAKAGHDLLVWSPPDGNEENMACGDSAGHDVDRMGAVARGRTCAGSDRILRPGHLLTALPRAFRLDAQAEACDYPAGFSEPRI